MKNCGGCRFYKKFKKFGKISGTCEFFDYKVNQDDEHCIEFKKPKYKRKKIIYKECI